MKTTLALLSTLAALAAPGAEAPAVRTLQGRIVAVTVYADRAQVARTADWDLPAGESVAAWTGLPGWIDEESVRLALVPAAAGEIVDVRVKREFFARAGDEEVRKAEEDVQELADRIAALDDEKAVVAATQKQVEQIRVFQLDKMPRDAAVQGIKVEDYGRVVDFVADRLKASAAALRDLEKRRREWAPELAARQRRLGELQARRQLEQCTVLVTVRAPAAQRARLTLSCFLPGASWEPSHELRTDPARPDRVTLVSYATVAQTTGEDWTGADLAFSTQSPSDIMEMPEPDAVLLDGRPAASAAARKGASSFAKARALFDAQQANWYDHNYRLIEGVDFSANCARLTTLRDRINQLFAELSKRGTSTHFPGEGRPAVYADGRPARVVIGRADAAAKPGILAVPAKTLNAVRTVEMSNTCGYALLPGRVSVYEGGTFLGLADLSFAAEGESFALALGIADQVKLSRTLDRKRSSFVRGDRNRIEAAFVIVAENLSDRPAAVKLLDRVPVSQERDIKVSGVALEPAAPADPKGLVQWNLALGPREKKTVRLGYTLEYPTAYLQPAPERGRLMRSAGEAAAPAAAEPPGDLQMQIQDLEQRF